MKSSLICVCFTWTEVKTKSDRLKRYEIQIRQSLPFRPGRRNKEMVILHENWGWGIGGGGVEGSGAEKAKYNLPAFINGPGPAYLSDLLHYSYLCHYGYLHVYTPSRTLRSSSGIRMLKIQQHKRKTHGLISHLLLLWTPHLEFTPTRP